MKKKGKETHTMEEITKCRGECGIINMCVQIAVNAVLSKWQQSYNDTAIELH